MLQCHQVRRGNNYSLPAVLVSSVTHITPFTSIDSGTVEVFYRRDSDDDWIEKTIDGTSWSNLGRGWYEINFLYDELSVYDGTAYNNKFYYIVNAQSGGTDSLQFNGFAQITDNPILETFIEKNISEQLPAFLVDSADRITPETNITTPNVYYQKEGGAFTQKTMTSSNWLNLGYGWYEVIFTGDELNTEGQFRYIVDGGVGAIQFNTVVQVADKESIIFNMLSQIRAISADKESIIFNMLSQIRAISGNKAIINTTDGTWDIYNDSGESILVKIPLEDKDGNPVSDISAAGTMPVNRDGPIGGWND